MKKYERLLPIVIAILIVIVLIVVLILKHNKYLMTCTGSVRVAEAFLDEKYKVYKEDNKYYSDTELVIRQADSRLDLTDEQLKYYQNKLEGEVGDDLTYSEIKDGKVIIKYKKGFSEYNNLDEIREYMNTINRKCTK